MGACLPARPTRVEGFLRPFPLRRQKFGVSMTLSVPGSASSPTPLTGKRFFFPPFVVSLLVAAVFSGGPRDRSDPDTGASPPGDSPRQPR